MEKEEIQELIRTTITEMLSEMERSDDHQDDQHEDQHEEREEQHEEHEEQHEEQHEEEKPSEMAQLRDEIKALKAAIHHANFLNAGSNDKPAPELTPEQIFNDLINPKKGENK